MCMSTALASFGMYTIQFGCVMAGGGGSFGKFGSVNLRGSGGQLHPTQTETPHSFGFRFTHSAHRRD